MSDISSTPTTTPCTPEPYPEPVELTTLEELSPLVPLCKPMPFLIGSENVCICKVCRPEKDYDVARTAYDFIEKVNDERIFSQNYEESPSWYKLLTEKEKARASLLGFDLSTFPDCEIEDDALIDILKDAGDPENISKIDIPTCIGNDYRYRYSIYLKYEEELLKEIPGFVRLYAESLHNSSLVTLLRSINFGLADLYAATLKNAFTIPTGWKFNQETVYSPFGTSFKFGKDETDHRTSNNVFHDYFSLVSIHPNDKNPNFVLSSYLPYGIHTSQSYYITSKWHSEYQQVIFAKELHQLKKIRELFKSIGFNWITREDVDCRDIYAFLGFDFNVSTANVGWYLYECCSPSLKNYTVNQLEEFKKNLVKKYQIMYYSFGGEIKCDDCIFAETGRNKATHKYSWQDRNLPSLFPHEFHDHLGCKGRDHVYLTSLLHGRRFARCKRALPEEFKPEEPPLKIVKNY